MPALRCEHWLQALFSSWVTGRAVWGPRGLPSSSRPGSHLNSLQEKLFALAFRGNSHNSHRPLRRFIKTGKAERRPWRLAPAAACFACLLSVSPFLSSLFPFTLFLSLTPCFSLPLSMLSFLKEERGKSHCVLRRCLRDLGPLFYT